MNVAARLEQLAEPGGIAISGSAHDQVVGKIERQFEDWGEQQVKNIARPVRVYALAGRSSPPLASSREAQNSSIAVLPFTNLSEGQDTDYFAEAITDEITVGLSRFRRLFVVSKSSSFVVRDRARDVREIGKALGVRYLLEGAVRRAGQRVRITAQLVDTATATNLWADKFEGDLHDIFSLQDELAERVVTAIEPKVQRVRAGCGRSPRMTTRRLSFVLTLLSALATHAHADPTSRRIALLADTGPCTGDPYGFWAALAAHGWIESRTMTIDCVSAVGRLDQVPALAQELVARKPDAAVAITTVATRALARATQTIPIVMSSPDPVADGFAESLSRPGRNITGLSSAGVEVVGKRLEALKEVLPGASTVGVLLRTSGGDPAYMAQLARELEAGTSTQGLKWVPLRFETDEELDPLFASARAAGTQALYIAPTPLNYRLQRQIADAAARHGLAAVGENKQFVASGALISYGFDYDAAAVKLAAQVDRVLRGAKPETLPIERPTRFLLAVNLKTARRLGIEVSPTLLARADEVIE